mmetsp:Transcript_57872/g.124321  ORF Transcript_57872/g.124321 Transcript_57872/m.124321 type:complete len:221 (+) Transcript_57872:1866-2528(+)
MSHAPWHRSNQARHLFGLLETDIAHNARLLRLPVRHYGVHAHIDHDRVLLQPRAPYKGGLPDASDDDVRSPHVFLDIPSLRMADGDSAVLTLQHQRHWHADGARAAEDNSLTAREEHLGLDKHLHDPSCDSRQRERVGAPCAQAPTILQIETIDILPDAYCGEHLPLVQVHRQWQLDEDPVHGIVLHELADHADQLILGHAFREAHQAAADAAPLRHRRL